MSYTTTHNDKRRDGRDADFVELEKGLQSEDKNIRRNASEASWRIRQESGAVKNMREALIMAHRRGDINEVKNIQMDMVNNSQYQIYK